MVKMIFTKKSPDRKIFKSKTSLEFAQLNLKLEKFMVKYCKLLNGHIILSSIHKI